MRPVTLRQPTALIPLVMSLGALAVVIGHIATVGVAREADEGIEAHLWQFLMAGQIPVIAFFAISWLPRDPRHAMRILGVQVIAAIAAAAPVLLLRF